MGDMSKEPSMEEILSSIKRIIAEEGEEISMPPRALRRARAEAASIGSAGIHAVPADDVLELTPPDIEEAVVFEEEEAVADSPVEEAVIEEAEVSYEEPVEEAPAVEDVLELSPPEEIQPEIEEAQPEAVAEEAPVAEEVLELTNEIETEETVATTEAARKAPHILSVESEVATRNSLSALSSMVITPEPGAENTLEGLVQSMLRPILKDWLDENLPGMVEKMVAKEISRITAGMR